MRDHYLGAVTTGPDSGFEIFVPGRQDSSQSEIPLSGAPISFVGTAPFFFFPQVEHDHGASRMTHLPHRDLVLGHHDHS